MPKKLTDMTLEELWQLFPIILTEHRECWDEQFRAERDILRPLLPEDTLISHIGSTAVAGIRAKPIIDILVELPRNTAPGSVKDILCSSGYLCMSETAQRISFNKGYTEQGFAERVFHIHVRCRGDNDELYFVKYLKEHPDTAREYETLKLSLWKQYAHDRDGYTEAKGDFVRAVTALARSDYPGCFDR